MSAATNVTGSTTRASFTGPISLVSVHSIVKTAWKRKSNELVEIIKDYLAGTGSVRAGEISLRFRQGESRTAWAHDVSGTLLGTFSFDGRGNVLKFDPAPNGPWGSVNRMVKAAEGPQEAPSEGGK